ncbi:serine protease [Myxococcaceae bacterium GXIMD 01537]
MERVLNRWRAVIGPTAREGLVREALEALRGGQSPTPRQLAALEGAIRVFRPSLLSRGGLVGPLPPEAEAAFPLWGTFREAVRPLLPSVGRIERAVDARTREAVGTGFLVGPGLLATSRHVLEDVSAGTGVLERGQALIWFGQEYGTPDAEGPVDIVGVIAEHPVLDLALLAVEGSRRPLELSSEPAAPGEPVAVVGYPTPDGARNPHFAEVAFEGKMGVKRVAPGEVMKVLGPSVHHDCSTLGGNSGSPLLSLRTARVVGVHFRGGLATRNTAVAASELAAFLQAHAPR